MLNMVSHNNYPYICHFDHFLLEKNGATFKSYFSMNKITSNEKATMVQNIAIINHHMLIKNTNL